MSDAAVCMLVTAWIVVGWVLMCCGFRRQEAMNVARNVVRISVDLAKSLIKTFDEFGRGLAAAFNGVAAALEFIASPRDRLRPVPKSNHPPMKKNNEEAYAIYMAQRAFLKCWPDMRPLEWGTLEAFEQELERIFEAVWNGDDPTPEREVAVPDAAWDRDDLPLAVGPGVPAVDPEPDDSSVGLLEPRGASRVSDAARAPPVGAPELIAAQVLATGRRRRQSMAQVGRGPALARANGSEEPADVRPDGG